MESQFIFKVGYINYQIDKETYTAPEFDTIDEAIECASRNYAADMFGKPETVRFYLKMQGYWIGRYGAIFILAKRKDDNPGQNEWKPTFNQDQYSRNYKKIRDELERLNWPSPTLDHDEGRWDLYRLQQSCIEPNTGTLKILKFSETFQPSAWKGPL
jgi:hypothetical protein